MGRGDLRGKCVDMCIVTVGFKIHVWCVFFLVKIYF